MTNLVAGHDMIDKGIKTANEVEMLYTTDPLDKRDIKHRVIIINVNKTYKEGVSPYEATRKSWKCRLSKLKQVEYVFSEYKGIVRKIYKPEKWLQDEANTKRYLFEGIEVTDKAILDLYLNKHLINCRKKGNRNPIRYINI